MILLFVDDDPLVLRSLKRGLAGRWESTFAASGQAALDAITAHDFDIVISDLCMPEVDGRQVLAAALEKSDRTIRVLMTALVDTTGLEADYVIAKPCSLAELVAFIERLGGKLVSA